ncbi:SDR family oxidoreductase [Bordetella holmesii]
MPLRRVRSKPNSFAAAIAFLLSDDAAYITGQVLGVDGGGSLGGR